LNNFNIVSQFLITPLNLTVMKVQLTLVAIIMLCLAFIVSSFRKVPRTHKEPGSYAKTNTRSISETIALFGEPIDPTTAKRYIKYYQAKGDSTSASHFWLDKQTISYLNSLFTKDANADGVRVYLADYDEEVTVPGTNTKYPKDTRTIILVGTRAEKNADGPNGVIHADWYGGNGSEAIQVYNYSEPCPPGKGCRNGATLAQ
jgi:hypothetical protein